MSLGVHGPGLYGGNGGRAALAVRAAGGARFPGRAGDRGRRPPRCHRALAWGGARGTDAARLWPLRCAATRSGGRLGLAPLRADSAQWPPARPRRVGRQGPLPAGGGNARRFPRGRGQIAGQCHPSAGRRGGMRIGNPRRDPQATCRQAAGRCRAVRRWCALARRPADHDGWYARQHRDGTHAAHGGEGPPFRPLWRRRAECAACHGEAARHAARCRRAGRRRRFLGRRATADGGRSRGPRPHPLRRCRA